MLRMGLLCHSFESRASDGHIPATGKGLRPILSVDAVGVAPSVLPCRTSVYRGRSRVGGWRRAARSAVTFPVVTVVSASIVSILVVAVLPVVSIICASTWTNTILVISVRSV